MIKEKEESGNKKDLLLIRKHKPSKKNAEPPLKKKTEITSPDLKTGIDDNL